MLTLTPAATKAVRTLVAGTDVDDETGGLRISPGDAAEQGGTLELALVNGPEGTDHQIAAGGARVFLEPTVAGILDDKMLDAAVESGQVRFVLFNRRTPDGDPPS